MNPLKSLILSLPILILMMVAAIGQENHARLTTPLYPYAARMHDSITAVRIPLLQFPENYRGRSLPAIIDNSQNNYWPGIQDQFLFYSCQQYCGVVYVYGYEINRMRNLNGLYTENYYPAHYTWNFMNQGDRYIGVNFLQSFEVIKQQGHMTSLQYGNDTSTSVLEWVNGYDKYYQGMFNHLKQVYAIQVNSVEGINTLKNYLYDHLDGSSTGGIVCFTTDSYTLINMPTLPPGTPEEGKDVIQFWQPNPVHGLAVVGYNDSIRFDLNNDGKYTNNLDINGDGKIDALDWEIGAFKIANSYGHWWSNDGFVWALYSSFARNYIEGGVWNNRVYIVEADTAYRPLLTAKVKLRYDSRNRIRVLAGVSKDTLHSLPEHTIDFPIFNFQGGDNVMQGIDSVPEGKSIEFGLDLTPLLNFVPAGDPARYFFMVEERDPDHLGQGAIEQVSFINYQNGIREFPANTGDVIINDNEITAVSTVGTMAKPGVQIVTGTLPPVIPSQPYNVQLVASGGKSPYDWSIREHYTMLPSSGVMPLITGTSIQSHQEFKSYTAVALPFSFPFYGKKYDSIYVNYFGFITFDPQYLPEPYITDEMNMLEMFASVVPSFSQQYTYQANKNDGIWFQADASRAIIRWKVSVSPYVTSSVNDFALVLYPDGKFDFRYGNMSNQGFVHTFYSGISKGDEQNFDLKTQWNANDVAGKSYRFIPPVLPLGVTMSKGGMLSVSSADSAQIYDIPIQVADAGKITDEKVFTLSDGLDIRQQLICGSDDRLEFGCNARLKLLLTNSTVQPIQNLILEIRSLDSLVQISDSIVNIASLQPGIPLTIDAAFSFGLKSRLPDDYLVRIAMQARSGQREWNKEMPFRVAGHSFSIINPMVSDGDNNILDPGEVADLIVPLENTGSLGGQNLNLVLISHDTLVSIRSQSSISISQVGPRSKNNFQFQIAASRETHGGHVALMELKLTDSSGTLLEMTFNLAMGKKPVVLVNLATSRLSYLAMARSLDSLRVGYDTIFELPFDYNRYQCIFVILGSSSQGSHALTIDEAASLVGYLANGGNLYLEGYYTWYYLNKTPLHPWFKYTTSKIPIYYYTEANGVPGTLTDSLAFAYTGYQNYALFSFIPSDPAVSTFVNTDATPKNLEIAYDGDDYKTIGTFLDFGSMNGSAIPSSQQTLMQRYLEFFDLNITGPFPLFHAAQTTSCLGRIVNFTDDSFDHIVTRTWEFEGGTPAVSSETSPAVIYQQPGKFDVKLTVSDGIHTKSILKNNYMTIGICTEIGEILAEPLFRIFPNPASDRISIDFFQDVSGECNVTLFDLMGRKVMDLQKVISAGENFILDVSGVGKGLYFLRVKAGGMISTQKVILR